MPKNFAELYCINLWQKHFPARNVLFTCISAEMFLSRIFADIFVADVALAASGGAMLAFRSVLQQTGPVLLATL